MLGREADAFLPLLQRRVPSKSALIVHSAIARLSRQGYRAEAMIDAFLAHIDGGHMFMPAMTWRTVTPEHPFWDEMTTPSHTGVLSEVFRTRYSNARSIHPTHSVAGLGPNAKSLLSRHHIDDTPVSANSPYGLLRDYDTHILTIGVGLECVTAIHLPEEIANVDLFVRPQVEMYECRDRDGVVHEVRARRHWRRDRDFNQFAPALLAAGKLEQGEIDGCPYTIVSQRDLLDIIFKAFERDPAATLSAQARAARREA
jgi:aminoglycoside 3-N-acetyltransferase